LKNSNGKNDAIINEDIEASEVRCIKDGSEQVGVVPLSVALDMARSEGLDLVLVSPDAKPPVCKIMDYGKYRYQEEKKKKEAKKKQKVIEVKEIKLSVKIAQNDVNYKVKHAREFLEEGKHVRFRVFLKGRELSEPEGGVKVLDDVYKMIEDVADIDKTPVVEGRYVSLLVVPKPTKKH